VFSISIVSISHASKGEPNPHPNTNSHSSSLSSRCTMCNSIEWQLFYVEGHVSFFVVCAIEKIQHYALKLTLNLILGKS